MKRFTYTPEELEARRARLTREIEKKEMAIRRKWQDIISPPAADNKLSQWINRAEAAYSVFDGVMTGYRLCRNFSSFFRRKKSRR